MKSANKTNMSKGFLQTENERTDRSGESELSKQLRTFIKDIQQQHRQQQRESDLELREAYRLKVEQKRM